MTHIIIGGGIMGLLTAYYLHSEGEKVTLVEQGKLGRESSWAGGGILSPLYPWRYPDAVSALTHWSQQQYPALVSQLQAQTDIDAQCVQCGMMVLDHDEIKQATDWANTHDVDLQILSKQQVLNHSPGISPDTLATESIWMPDIGQVRNPRLLKALIAYLRSSDVNIFEDTPVTEILVDDSTVTGIRSHEQSIKGASVTVACGAWSSKVLQNWVREFIVEPVRGQMILFKAEPETLRSIILKDAHYLIPRKDGRIIIGSTLEFVGFDKSTTAQARESLKQYATDILPALRNFPIEHHWSGLRPGNSAQIPFISQHPEVNGLFVNTGHYRNGVVTAPASAKLCSQLILNKSPILDQYSYNF